MVLTLLIFMGPCSCSLQEFIYVLFCLLFYFCVRQILSSIVITLLGKRVLVPFLLLVFDVCAVFFFCVFRVCVRACVRARACLCVCVCVCVCMCVFCIYTSSSCHQQAMLCNCGCFRTPYLLYYMTKRVISPPKVLSTIILRRL